jgi:hypothetical protein
MPLVLVHSFTRSLVQAFLDPFHVEQIEAEDKVGGILAKVQGASDTLMWELDHELGLEAEAEGHH